MKKYLLILVATLAANFSEAKNLSAYFSYCLFYQPGSGPYVETYLNVAGSSVSLARDASGKLQGAIQVEWIFKQGEKIIHFDKYNLLSPPLADEKQPVRDFIDQQRVTLTNGKYTVHLKISDKQSGAQPFTATQELLVDFPEHTVALS